MVICMMGLGVPSNKTPSLGFKWMLRILSASRELLRRAEILCGGEAG